MCVLQDPTATQFTKFELMTDRFMHHVETLKLENISYDINSFLLEIFHVHQKHRSLTKWLVLTFCARNM